MKNWLTITFIVLVSFGNLAVECDGSPPLGSTNRPYPTTYPIDTTKIVHLKEPISITLKVTVREFDRIKTDFFPIDSALVHFYNKDTMAYTNSTGWTSIIFYTDTLPYKYKYDITVSGYGKKNYYNWDTVRTLSCGVSFDKVN